MRYANITGPDVNNGIGFRITFWIQGCSHHCSECHNPETWDFKGGTEVNEELILEDLKNQLDKPYIQGITFSGGDPMESCNFENTLFCTIADYVHSLSKDVWVYSGYTLEELLTKEYCLEFLSKIDVLVDGKYEKYLRDITLPFRGSSNQRIIDVQQSLQLNKIVLWD